MREEAVSRRVGRDASGGPDAGSRASSGRSGRVQRRGRRPRTAPGTTSTRARPVWTLGTRDTTACLTSCLVARRTAGRRRSAYERTVSAPCGYRTMSEQSRIARSLEPRIARKAASAHPRSSPSRTLSCDVMAVVVIRTPARAGRCAWVQRRPLSGALLFSEERRAPLDGRSLLCVTLPRV